MRFVFYMNIISPHQLPLAHEIVQRVGVENFRYIYHHRTDGERTEMGWSSETTEWCTSQETEESKRWLEDAEVLVCGLRELDLFERRCHKGLRTFYTSERWFKPPLGMLRMLVPSYWRMARRFVRLAKLEPLFQVLPIGAHAQCDFGRMGVPEAKMATWGYFVSPSSVPLGSSRETDECLRVLWVGRMLKLKNVDVLIRAVQQVQKSRVKITLTLVGDGPERLPLQRLADGNVSIHFRPSVKIDQVRQLMREHDVYVFPSNGYDGWGAVVSEALEEGMLVLGSFEAGASATMLPQSRLFHARDWRRLAQLLEEVAQSNACSTSRASQIGDWSATAAADRLLALCGIKESIHA